MSTVYVVVAPLLVQLYAYDSEKQQSMAQDQEAFGSQLQTGSALTIVVIWEVNQKMEDLSVKKKKSAFTKEILDPACNGSVAKSSPYNCWDPI